MSKLEDTRIVTFKEDYTGRQEKPGKDDKDQRPPIVYMKKGTVHAIHKNVVARLVQGGAKIEVKEVDIKAVTKAAKLRHESNQERREKDAYKK